MATNQAGRLKRVGENLHVNDHGIYFAWFSMRGKQIKRSLKTEDSALARWRLADLREKTGRLHGGEQRIIRFEELDHVEGREIVMLSQTGCSSAARMKIHSILK
jgi:hypothetical protein